MVKQRMVVIVIDVDT